LAVGWLQCCNVAMRATRKRVFDNFDKKSGSFSKALSSVDD